MATKKAEKEAPAKSSGTRFNVPGVKASKGLTEYKNFVDGDYTLQCDFCEVKPPKNNSPTDVWTFKTKILSGPPQADGSLPAKKTYYFRINVMHPEHPSMFGKEPSDQRGVDEMKSLLNAAGLVPRGDDISPESFAGAVFGVHITERPDQNDPTKLYNNNSRYFSAE